MILGYRNISYIPSDQVMRVFTWSEDGDRIFTDIPYNPYFYYEVHSGEYDAISLFNTKLKKIVCKNNGERNKKIADIGIERIYENISAKQQFLIDQFYQDNEKSEFSQFPLKVWYLDIECNTSKYSFNHMVKIRKKVNKS